MIAWSNLPNAAHMLAMLEDVKARPEVWEQATVGIVAGSKDRTVAWAEAYRVSRDTVRDLAWGPLWDAACDGLGDTAERAVGDAVCALIAWDESSALLDLTPDALRTLIVASVRTLRPSIRVSKSPVASRSGVVCVAGWPVGHQTTSNMPSSARSVASVPPAVVGDAEEESSMAPPAAANSADGGGTASLSSEIVLRGAVSRNRRRLAE